MNMNRYRALTRPESLTTETFALGGGYVLEMVLSAEPETCTPREGYADCGEYAADNAQAAEDAVRRCGVWGFGAYRVTARLRFLGRVVFEGADTLGQCAYNGPVDFARPGGYYGDMRAVAVEALGRCTGPHHPVASALADLAPWEQAQWEALAALHGELDT